MTAILLIILKWIGIILLFLLGLIILLMVLLLFFPFVYRLNVEKKEEFKAKISLSYLFRLINISLSYQNKAPLFVARILGIPVYKTDFAPLFEALKDAQNASEKQDTAKDESNDESLDKQDVELSKDSTVLASKDAQAESESEILTEEEIEEEIKSVMEEEEQKIPFLQKIKLFLQKIKQFISKCKKKCYNIYDSILAFKKKIEFIIKNIKYYYKLLNHPAVKPAWQFLLKQLGKVWRNVKPRKVRVYVNYGASDPAQTAKVYGYYCMIYPFFGKSIRFEPDLENEVLVADAGVRGRIQVYRFVLIGLSLALNRNCRKVVKLLMREVKKRGRK